MENKRIRFTKKLLIQKGTDFLEGKDIEWFAPSLKYDSTYRGIAHIIAIFPDDEHPLHTLRVTGDQLDSAFWCDGVLCFSDCLREVEFEVKVNE